MVPRRAGAGILTRSGKLSLVSCARNLTPPQLSRSTFIVALLLTALIAAAAVAFATRNGIGLSRDSETYFAVARQLLEGKGFSIPAGSDASQPLTHYPPLYPIVLAGLGKMGLDVASGARLLNIVMFASSVLLTGLIFRRGLRLPCSTSLLGAALTAMSIDLVRTYAQAWSEGPFIFLMLAAWLLLGLFLDDHRRAMLIAAALAVALATLTRYAGLGLTIAGAAALLIYGERTRRQRFADLALFLAISCVPIATWFIRNLAHTGSAANRQLAFHLPGGKQMQMAMITIAEWMWPAPSERNWLTWTAFGIVLTLVIIACTSARNARAEGRRESGQTGNAAGVIACFAIVYSLFVLTSVTLVDASTPLDFRILAPLHLALLIGIIARAYRDPACRPPPEHGRAIGPTILAITGGNLLAGQAARTTLWAYHAFEEARGLRHPPPARFRARPICTTASAGCCQILLRKYKRHDDAPEHGSSRQSAAHHHRSRHAPAAATVARPRPSSRHPTRAGICTMATSFTSTTMRHPEFIPEEQLVQALNLELVHADPDGKCVSAQNQDAAKSRRASNLLMLRRSPQLHRTRRHNRPALQRKAPRRTRAARLAASTHPASTDPHRRAAGDIVRKSNLHRRLAREPLKPIRPRISRRRIPDVRMHQRPLRADRLAPPALRIRITHPQRHDPSDHRQHPHHRRRLRRIPPHRLRPRQEPQRNQLRIVHARRRANNVGQILRAPLHRSNQQVLLRNRHRRASRRRRRQRVPALQRHIDRAIRQRLRIG